MAVHSMDFYRGVAMILEGENLKVTIYVHHGHSLGVIREQILDMLLS